MSFISKLSLKKLLDNKKFCIILSIVLAVAFWFAITVTESPDSENTIGGLSVSIPIEGSVVSEMGMDVIGDPASYTATVTVKGPAYVVSDLSGKDILVTAAISNVTNAGTYSLDLRATKQAGAEEDFEITSISPRSINVTFDYIESKQFTVITQAVGYKAVSGLIAEQPFVSDSNNAVLNFKGARTEIAKIAKVVAVADVNKTLEKSETFAADLKVYDDKDNELNIKNYTVTTADGLSAPDMQITVPIYKEKTVPIKAQFVNAPAYFASKTISHTLSYTSLLISGPPETVDNITEIKLAEIDFDKITANDQTFEAAIILPEGVKNKDNIETVMVKVTGLEGYTTRTYTVSNLVVKSGGKTATLSRNIRNVKVFGPKSVLNDMAASKLYAEVDTQGLESGEHTVTARIKCKESGKVWQIGTYTATVNIK